MTYGEIVTEIEAIIYGETTAPDFVGTRLRGSEGKIARVRKEIQDTDYWFMKRSHRFPLADGERSYTPNIKFKKEISLKLEDYSSGDYRDALTKVDSNDLAANFQDIDGETEYPTHYAVEYNPTLDLKQFDFYDRPSDTQHSTELSVGSTAERIANTAFTYQIGGTSYSGAVNAAGSTFTSGDTINTGAAAGTYWGAWSIEIDSSGNIYTYPAGGLSDQVYTSEAEAVSNLPEPTYHPMGYVAIESNTGASWTANTDDLTEGSDCTSCNFYNASVVAKLDYWRFFDDLSDTAVTFNAAEDEISTECKDLIIWECVKFICTILKQWQEVQAAKENIAEQRQLLKKRNSEYKMANFKIRYRNT